MFRIFGLASTVAVLLTGCVNLTAEKPIANEEKDPIEYTAAFLSYAEKGLINPWNLTETWEKNTPDARMYRRWICTSFEEIEAYWDGIRQVCKNLNGTVVGAGWCMEINTAAPLFQVTSPSGIVSGCSNWNRLIVQVLAPHLGVNPADKSWVSYARNQGFRTGKEIQRQAQYEVQQLQMKAKAEQERVQRKNQRLLSGEKGIAVRKTTRESGYYFYGYVEDASKDKIKVYIYRCGNPEGTLSLGGGLTPHYIWDSPNNWEIVGP